MTYACTALHFIHSITHMGGVMSYLGFFSRSRAALFVVCAVFLLDAIHAQQTTEQITRVSALKSRDPQVFIQWEKKTGVPSRIRGILSAKTTAAGDLVAREFFRSNASLFRMKNADQELRVLTVKKAVGNWEHVRLQQHYGTFPVEGGVMALHIDQDRVVREVQGAYLPIARLDTTIQVLRAQAEQTVLAQTKSRGQLRKPTSSQAVIYRLDSTNHVVWKVQLFSASPLGDFVYYVDAHSGQVVDWYDNLKHGRYRLTYDANHGTGGVVLKRREGQPATGDAVLDAAHDNAGKVYDFYSTTFGRDSWDNQGDSIRSIVHFDVNYNNAFWDGNSLTYGDGDGSNFGPFSQALDVVAHEFTHGVTQAEGDLVYRNQSGALNESYSDIFGALIDPPDWMMGEDCYTPGESGDALRYLDDPPRGDQPDHMSNYLITTSDNGGVHTNSGIPNKAAYLMSEGGTHHGVTVVGIGRSKMAKVFYGSYNWLTPNATFNDAREATLAAARIEFPADTIAVDRAWRAVGVVAIQLTFNPADRVSTRPGDSAEVTVSAMKNGDPLSGAFVALNCENSGIATISPAIGTTDDSGILKAKVRGVTKGQSVLHANAFAGPDTATGVVTVKVPVSPLAGYLALVASLLAVSLLRRRSKH
jgi:bacillolysin